MKTLFTSPYLLMYHHGFGQVLELEWLGFANSEQLRSAMLEGLRLARLYHIRAWIGNLQGMGPIEPADQEWLNQTWFPLFSELDITHLALVKSRDALNRAGVTQVLVRAGDMAPLSTAWFDTIEQARAWVSTSAITFPAHVGNTSATW